MEIRWISVLLSAVGFSWCAVELNWCFYYFFDVPELNQLLICANWWCTEICEDVKKMLMIAFAQISELIMQWEPWDVLSESIWLIHVPLIVFTCLLKGFNNKNINYVQNTFNYDCANIEHMLDLKFKSKSEINE